MSPKLGSWLSVLGGLIILGLSFFIVMTGVAGFSSDDMSVEVRALAKGFHFLFAIFGSILLVMSLISLIVSLRSAIKGVSLWGMIFTILTGFLSILPALIFTWPAVGSLLLITGGIIAISTRNQQKG